MIEVSFKKRVGSFELDISLEADKEFTILFGPSGSGKSLVLQCVAGLIKPDSGRIRVGGLTFFDSEKRLDLPINKRRVGYVLQECALFPHMTIYQNIAYGISKLSRGEIRTKVGEVVELLRLKGLERRYPNQVSGGQRQRVEIARALVTDPLVLLMDEPFASLDYPVRSKIMMDLFRIQKDRPVATIFVTHDFEEAYMLGDKIAVIENGRIEQVAPKEEVFYRPATRKVAKFFGAKNIFRGVVCQMERQTSKMVLKNDRFSITMDVRPGAEEGDSMMFCIRPEEIKILRPGRPIKDTLKDNIFSGRIAEVIEKGAMNTIFFQMGDGDYDFQIDVPSHAYRDLELEPGKEITISLKRNSIWPISRDSADALGQRRSFIPL